MNISINPDTFKQTKWYEYAIRLGFGGLVVALTGLIAHKFGSVIGGLFLAFPSIFPASVTLVEMHKKKKEQKDGNCGDRRAKKAAAADAAGAAFGSIGLLAFALVAWVCTPRLSVWLTLALATLAWAVVSFLAWLTRRRLHRMRRPNKMAGKFSGTLSRE